MKSNIAHRRRAWPSRRGRHGQVAPTGRRRQGQGRRSRRQDRLARQGGCLQAVQGAGPLRAQYSEPRGAAGEPAASAAARPPARPGAFATRRAHAAAPRPRLAAPARPRPTPPTTPPPRRAPIPARSPTRRPSRSRWKPPARIRRPAMPPARRACARSPRRWRLPREALPRRHAAPRPPRGLLFAVVSGHASPPHPGARAPDPRDRAVNEHGEPQSIAIPAERALTVYVDKRELVTLMTLGAHPEWLVLGYLRNQRLVASRRRDRVHHGRLGSRRRRGARPASGIDRIEERTARRVVTTGCGQGSVFGGLMDEVDSAGLPAAAHAPGQLYGIVNAIRLQESTYKSAGSVHGCALFRGEEMLLFVEDVGRHNAIDTIAGWMWMQARPVRPATRRSCSTRPAG